MQWPARNCEPRGVVPNRGGAETRSYPKVTPGRASCTAGLAVHEARTSVKGSLNVCAHTGGAGAQ